MEETPVVIDNGSHMSKAGFAGQEGPMFELHSTTGSHRYFEGFKESYVGDGAYKRKSMLTLKHPIERGVITSWDDMEKVGRVRYNIIIISMLYCTLGRI